MNDKELTQKEIEILDLCSAAPTIKEICNMLGITRSTFNTHKKNIRHKTGATTYEEMVAYSIKNGFGKKSTVSDTHNVESFYYTYKSISTFILIH